MKRMQKVEDYNIKTFKWDFKGLGLFETTLKNNKITDLKFCRNRSSLDMALFSADMKFLRAVNKALTDLFEYLKITEVEVK